MTYTRRLFIVLLTALTTGGAFHYTRPPVKDAEMSEAWFWANKFHNNQDVCFFFVGDSRINQGIDPRKFEDLFPDRTFRNLGYPAAGYTEDLYQYLEEMIENTDQTPVLVLGITPYALTPLALDNKHLKQELNRPETEIQKRLTLYPWLSFFEPIRPSHHLNATSEEGYYATYHPTGWKEAYGIPEDPGTWLPRYRNFFRDEQVSEEMLNGLFSFIQRMNEQGVPVLGLRFPTTRQMEEIEDELSGFDEEAFAEAFEKSGGIWIPLEDRFAYFSYDGSHLHYKAARSFSGHLAEWIHEALGSRSTSL